MAASKVDWFNRIGVIGLFVFFWPDIEVGSMLDKFTQKCLISTPSHKNLSRLTSHTVQQDYMETSWKVQY